MRDDLSQAEADLLFLDMVEHQMRTDPSISREQAEAVERHNLGYFTGYYSHETRARVERLFRCAHPVFGAIAVNGPPSPEQAFKLGLEMSEKHRARKHEALPTLWDHLGKTDDPHG